MKSTDLLTDAFDRIVQSADAVLDGLDDAQLTARVGPDANTIAWLIWHLARVQDDHVADAAGSEQVWTAQDFVARFALPLAPSDIGYGFSSEQVAKVRAPGALLSEYLHAVHERTVQYLGTLSDEDLDRVVDTRWDPPVTLGVRLVSVLNDDTQHVGQAAYVRGLLGV